MNRIDPHLAFLTSLVVGCIALGLPWISVGGKPLNDPHSSGAFISIPLFTQLESLNDCFAWPPNKASIILEQTRTWQTLGYAALLGRTVLWIAFVWQRRQTLAARRYLRWTYLALAILLMLIVPGAFQPGEAACFYPRQADIQVTIQYPEVHADVITLTFVLTSIALAAIAAYQPPGNTPQSE